MIVTRTTRPRIKVTADRICNRCGQSMAVRDGDFLLGFYGISDVCLDGGYASRSIYDGDRYRFDLCEACAVWLIGQFKVAPDYHNAIDGDSEIPEKVWREQPADAAPEPDSGAAVARTGDGGCMCRGEGGNVEGSGGNDPEP